MDKPDKRQLSSTLQELQLFLRENGLESYVREFILLQRFMNNPSFRISVLRGHYTNENLLINLLLDRQLLPERGGLPIHYTIDAGDEKALFSFEDGLVSEMPLADVSLEKFFAAGQALSGITFHIASEWLEKSNITITVQTPTGIPDAGGKALYTGPADSDVVLLMGDATAALGLLEREMLGNLLTKEFIPHVAVVIGKIEKVSPAERKTVVQYIQSRLSAIAAQIPLVLLAGEGETEPLSFEGTYNVAQLKNMLGSWAGDDFHQTLKERSIARHLLLLIGKIEADLIAKKLELVKNDEVKKRDLWKIRDKIEQKKLLWQDIGISVNQRSNDCILWLKSLLEKQKELTSDRLKYELSRSRNPREWWKNDLGHRLKIEMEIFVQGIGKSIESKVIGDITGILSQVKQLSSRSFPVQSPKNLVESPSFTVDAGAEGLKDINKARDIVRVITGSVSVASLFIIGPVGPLVTVAGGLIGEKLLSGTIKQQREQLSLQLGAVITDLFNQVFDGASGNIKVFYEDVVTGIRKQENSWIEEQDAGLQLYASGRDPVLLSIIRQIGTLESIRKNLL